MRYDKRNKDNLNKLADNTKIAAYKWYQYCIDKKYEVLIYETIRTKEKQAENVKKGASKTMKSYHIVGQALDFVFVDSKGSALWSINAYLAKMDAIKYAKSLGFTWGGDWDNDGDWRDETFLDSPHLQYNYKGYGTDTFGKLKPSHNPPTNNSVEKDDETMKFTSTTTKEVVRDHIKQMVDNGYIGNQWLTDFDNEKMTYGDYDGLRLISDQKKQNNK